MDASNSKIELIKSVRQYGERIHNLRLSINPFDVQIRLNQINIDRDGLLQCAIDGVALDNFISECQDHMRQWESAERHYAGFRGGRAFVGLREAKDFIESQMMQIKVEFVTHTYDNDPLPRHAFNSVEEAMKCIAENQRVGTYHIRNGFNRNENGLGDLLATITIE